MMTKRTLKFTVKLIADSFFIPFALYLSFAIRFGSFDVLDHYALDMAVVVTFFSLVLFILLGIYRAIVRYMGHDAFLTIITAVTLSSFLLFFISFISDTFLPNSIPILYWALLLLFVGGSRMLVWTYHKQQIKINKKSVIIYGAGESGMILQRSLFNNNRYRAIAFVDDDSNLHGQVVNGLRVYSPDKISALIEDKEVSDIFLALASVKAIEKKRVIQFLESFSVHVKTIPPLSDILSGRAQADEIKELEIEDLLGRNSIKPNNELLEQCIRNKVVLVTGAGGSIGSELCRQIFSHGPKTIVLFELSEYALYQIAQELETIKTNKLAIIALLGSVQDESRLNQIFRHYHVDTVYHAAAYKHVPLVEENIVEGIRNNVFGSCKAAKSAIECGVETFVLISTDKAVRPTNIMGASKRLAEMVLQSLAEKYIGKNSTRFCMVRFGNVLGSSGSVVPLFKRQIKKGGPITVTHPDINRYFMTIPEAVQLVLQAGSMGRGGDVFVLDMGKPVKIVDLAKKMIHLSGYDLKDEKNTQGAIEIRYTGLRPGEKLYEELLIGDNVSGTRHPEIMRAEEHFLPSNELEKVLERLNQACLKYDIEKIQAILLDNHIGYEPNQPINDLVWLAMNKR